MKQILFTTLITICTIAGFSQNFFKEYPINSTVIFNGSQQRLECTTYDSLLQTTVSYQTPWINGIIIANNNSGKVGFTTWITPVQQDTLYGFIIYDFLLHQFDVQLKSRTLTPTMRFNANSGLTGVVVTMQTESGGYFNVSQEFYRYNIFTHKWTKCALGYEPETSSITWTNGPVNFGDFVGFIDHLDELDLYYYDPFIDIWKYISSGCAGWGFTLQDDYIAMDTGCQDNYAFLTYDPELHDFVSPGIPDLLGDVNRGIFMGFEQNDGFPSYVFTYDQENQQYVIDSSYSETITNTIYKNRTAAYIDQPIGGSAKVIYMVYNPIIHNFVKDSALIAGSASGLVIENGTVKWTDANGINIRGYDVNTGWGSFTTPIFLNFHLTELLSQGLPMIHVRNYSLGTDQVYYDFGDGVTSPNNRHVLWHSYQDSGSYDVCIYDSSGAQSWCQTTTMNICGSVGSSSISNDTICLGDTTTLILANYVGSIQWQKQVGGTWTDDTTSGSTLATYHVIPNETTYYRAKVTEGICIPVFSNQIKVTVVTPVSNFVLSDSSFSICSGDVVKLSATNAVGIAYQWQSNTGSGWNSVSNGNLYSLNISPSNPIQYRVLYNNFGCFADSSSVIDITADALPSTPITSNVAICGSGMVNFNASSNGTIHWFLNSVLDSIIHTGNTFSPILYTTTQYKVRAYTGTTLPTGYPDTTIGTTQTSYATNQGLRIFSTSPVTLESFYVYPAQTGTLKLYLKKVVSNEIIATLQLPVVSSTAKIKVKWNIPLQSNTLYNIATDYGSIYVKANNSGISYPITTPGSPVTILGFLNYNGFSTNNTYYSLYDLTFTEGCKSPFVSVTGNVYPAIQSVISAAGPVIFCQGGSVQLNSTPNGNYVREWMKNGILTGITTQSYTANSPGSYQITVANSNCADTSSAINVQVPCIATFDPVERNDAEEFEVANAINIFYDPNTKNGIIASSLIETAKYKIEINDPSGKVFYKNEFEFNQGETTTNINMEPYASGVYVFKLFNGNESFIKKVVKY